MTTPSLSTPPPKRLPRARARFLAQAIQLEEDGISNIIKMAIYFSLFLFIATIIWASLTTVNEMTVSQGEVVPSGYIHDIQHLEGGIINEIAVRNGDQVNTGDLLIKFAEPLSQADYDQLHVKKATLALTQERLLAIGRKRKPGFGKIGQQYPVLASKEMASYHAQVASTKTELAVLKAQFSQRKGELNRQKNQVTALNKELLLLNKQVVMREKSVAKHFVSETELLTTKSQLAAAESQLRSVIDGISVASLAVLEAKSHRQEVIANHTREVEFELAETAGKLAEVEKSLIKAKDKVNRLNLFAPIPGIIQGVSVNRINAIVQAGAVILQIVPIDGNLIVESRVLPADIGHIHIGQKTEVRVDSYDVGKYGHINGVVQGLSPSTYLDEEMNPYYQARIELEKNHVGNNPAQMKIIPGMTVQVNVITGSKTILDYLMKPINRGFKNAFQEK